LKTLFNRQKTFNPNLPNSSGAEVSTSAPVVLLCNCPAVHFKRAFRRLLMKKEETVSRFLLDFV